MKIVKINDDEILFDNGKTISFYHCADCCEWNYADFKQLDDVAKATEFDEILIFEAVPNYGFRFGNANNLFFVPCYSEQNGYYSDDVDIFYGGEKVLNLECDRSRGW